MSLHIEINGDCSDREWDALAALVAIMRGTTALPTILNLTNVTLHDTLAPEEPEADPLPAGRSVAADVPPPPPSTPADAAEALMAAEETRVAAQAAASTPAAPKPPLSPPAGVELDSDGLPWDARIHASTKTKVQSDQKWKKIRKVDPALVKAVEAELREVMAAPVPDAPIVTDPAAAFAAPQADAVPPPPAADVPPPPATDVPPPPASEPEPAAPAADLTEFARIMKVVASKQTAKTLQPEMVTTIVQQLGLTGVRDFAKRPDLIPAFEALLP